MRFAQDDNTTHSRRIDPISLSTKPFCQGEPGAIGLSRMPMARNRWVKAAPRARQRQNRAIVAADVRRFAHVSKRIEFSVHTPLSVVDCIAPFRRAGLQVAGPC